MNGISHLVSEFRNQISPLNEIPANRKKIEHLFIDLLKVNDFTQVPSLLKRVVELKMAHLVSEDLFSTYFFVFRDEVYELKNDLHSISISKSIAKEFSETLKAGISSGIESTKKKYILDQKYEKYVFDTLKAFFSQGFVYEIELCKVLDVFECAKELQIRELEETCRESLIRQLHVSLNYENVMDFFYWSEFYNEPLVLEICLNYFLELPSDKYTAFTPHFKWKELTSEILILIRNKKVDLFKSHITIDSEQILAFKRIISALACRSVSIHFTKPLNYPDEYAFFIEVTLFTNPQVTSLTLVYVNNGILAAICKKLAVNTTLKSLALVCTRIGDEGAALIADMLTKNSSLTALDLSQNHIGQTGAEALGKALLKNKTLCTLNLFHNWLGNEGAVVIAKSLFQNTSIQILSLGSNYIKQTGGIAIGEMLNNNKTLKCLNLNENKIDNEGGIAIATSLLNNRTLKKLNLSSNVMEEKALLCFEEVLKSSTLTSIDLVPQN